MKVEDVVQKLENKYNFKPSKRYDLWKLEQQSGEPDLWDKQRVKPRKTIYLPRNPASGYTSIYDLETRRDFYNYFEQRFPDLEDGYYTAYTSRGGNNGFAFFFILRYENGQVIDKSWKKKSNGKEYGQSSSYLAFPFYFRERQLKNL